METFPASNKVTAGLSLNIPKVIFFSSLMSHDHTHIPTTQISTIDAFANTLKNDYQVNRWFLFLIQQPAADKELRESQSIVKDISHLNTAILIQRVLFLITFILIAVLIPAPAIMPVPFFFLIVTLAGLASLAFIKINLVRKIGLYMLRRDFTESGIGQLTLYEVGEYYSRKYHVTALVDKLNNTAVIYRIVSAAYIFVGIFVYTLRLPELIASLVAVLFLARLAINTNFIYSRIR